MQDPKKLTRQIRAAKPSRLPPSVVHSGLLHVADCGQLQRVGHLVVRDAANSDCVECRTARGAVGALTA